MSANRLLDRIVGVPLCGILGLFASKSELSRPLRKILVIKLAAVGDTILVGSALRQFRAAHPNADVHWLVSSINADIARLYPHVDRVMVWPGGLRSLPALIRTLRAENYDAIVDLEQWSRGTAIVSLLAGSPVRAGFDTPGEHRAGLFTRRFRKTFDRHEIFDFYGVLSLLGPLEESAHLELPVPENGVAELELKAPRLFEPGDRGPRVLIHPGCGSDGLPREWPLPDFGVLGHALLRKYNAQIILTAGPEEKRKTAQLQKLLNGAALDLGGQLSWAATIALVDRVDLVISGNTGVMHIAAALKKRQVALHGPTNPTMWGPLNENARVLQTSCPLCPCLKLGFEYHAKDQSCMKKLDAEKVKAAVFALIDKKLTI